MWGKHGPPSSRAAQSPCSPSNTEVRQPTSWMWMSPWSKSEFSISELCNLWCPFSPEPWNKEDKRKLATPAGEGRISATGALGYFSHKDCESGVEIQTWVKVSRKHKGKGADFALCPPVFQWPLTWHVCHHGNFPHKWGHQIHAWSSPVTGWKVTRLIFLRGAFPFRLNIVKKLINIHLNKYEI